MVVGGCGAPSDSSTSSASAPAAPSPEQPGPAAPIVMTAVDWGSVAPPGPPPSDVMTTSLLVGDRTGDRLATIEQEAGDARRDWLRIRDAKDFTAHATFPLCVAGPTDARASTHCNERRPWVRAAAFSPDGSAIAVACVGCVPGKGSAPCPDCTLPDASSVHVLATDTGALRFAVPIDLDPWVLAWGNDALFVAGRVADGNRYSEIDANDGSERRAVSTTEAIVGFAPDASTYITGASKQVVPLAGGPAWSGGSVGDKVVLLAGGGAITVDSISVVALDPGGKERSSLSDSGGGDIVAASVDGGFALMVVGSGDAPTRVRMVDVKQGALTIDQSVPGPIVGAVVLPGGVPVIAHAQDGLRRLEGVPPSRALAVFPDGTRVVSAETEGGPYQLEWTLRVRDAVSFEPALAVPSAPTTHLVVAPDGSQFAAATLAERSETGAIDLRAAATGSLVHTVALPFAVHALAWGERGVVAAGPRSIVTVDPTTAAIVVTPLPDDASLESLAPDGSGAAIRFQGGAYHEPMEGGHRTIVPAARIEWMPQGGGARRVLLADTHDGVIALAAGAWLHVEASALTRHDSTGAIVDRVEHDRCGTALLATADGRRVLCQGGDYSLALFDLATPSASRGAAPRVDLRSNALAYAMGPGGVLFFGRPGGGIDVLGR